MALCASLCITVSAGAQPPEPVSAVKKAEMRAERMQKELNLDTKQYKKLFKVFKKTEKAIEQAAMQNMRPPVGGPGMMPPGMMPGNGFGGGPGMMPPGHGMPPQGGPGNRQGPPDMKAAKPENMPEAGKEDPDMLRLPEMISEEEIIAREKETEKVKKILTPEQFCKWQKIESQRKGRP